MKSQSLNKQLISLLLTILVCGSGLFVIDRVLNAEDLWDGRNPYVPSVEVRTGEILRLMIDEPVTIDYDHEDRSDEQITVKLVPEKELMEYLPAVEDDRSFNRKGDVRLRSRARLRMRIAVEVTEIDPQTSTIQFTGSRVVGYEQDTAIQRITVSGKTSVRDIRNRAVDSGAVANLRIIIDGGKVQKNARVPMKQTTGENGEVLPSASLSPAERERVLLEYLNRVLGETGSLEGAP